MLKLSNTCRNRLFRIAKCTDRPIDRIKYNVKRHQIVSLLRNSKQESFDTLEYADSKTFWKTIRLLNNKRTSIPLLQHNGKTAESASSKATVLNNYFYGCFNNNFPPLTSSDPNYHNLNLDSTACPADFLCSDESVLDLITTLDVTKTTGHDGIAARMLKATAVSIAPQLCTLFNLFLTTGVFPSDWKIARIVYLSLKDPINFVPTIWLQTYIDTTSN